MKREITRVILLAFIMILLIPCVSAETPIITIKKISPSSKVVGFTQTISVYLQIESNIEIEAITGWYHQAHRGILYCEFKSTDEPDVYRLDLKIPSGDIDYMGDWYADEIAAHVKINGYTRVIELSFNINDTKFFVVNGPITPVDDIVLDQKILHMYIDDTVTVSQTVLPENATIKDVIWRSNDKNIATIENNIIAAKNVGATVVLCEATDHSDVKASCIVIVHSNEQVLLPEGLEVLENAVLMETGVIEVIIPSSVRIIEENAFANCNNLKMIYVPKSVVTIDDGAFNGCEQLIILCESNSKIIQFAEDNNLNYVVIDSE